MEYAVGKPGRIFSVKLTEGEDLYESLHTVAEKEEIKSAAVFITGGLRKADVVVGPKAEKPKLEPNFAEFIGPGETLGVGTLYRDDNNKPALHIHTAIGKEEFAMVGCPRGGAKVFLILEITIIEIAGIKAVRKSAASGVKLLEYL